MAKSLKSKWKRKMRAIKREKYGKKELERLKKMLETDNQNIEHVDIHMKDEDSKIKKCSKGAEKMDTDSKKARSSKTLMDEHGSFPVWMHPRQRKKITHKIKKKKKSKIG